MRTTPLSSVFGAAAVVLLTACAPAAPADTAQPSAAPPSAAAAVSPAYCGDELVSDLIDAASTAWQGSSAQQLAQARPDATFRPANMLDGLDVRCVASYRLPADGGPGVAVISQAVVEPSAGTLEALAAWAAANGYAVPAGSTSRTQLQGPTSRDGSTTRVLSWAPLDGVHPLMGSADRIVELTGAEPDSVVLRHAETTMGTDAGRCATGCLPGVAAPDAPAAPAPADPPPAATPTSTPTQPPEPAPDEPDRMCSVDYIVDFINANGYYAENTIEEQIAGAAPAAGFEPAAAIEGLDVRCTMTFSVPWQWPGDDALRLSMAVVNGEGDADVAAVVGDYAQGAGFERVEGVPAAHGGSETLPSWQIAGEPPAGSAGPAARLQAYELPASLEGIHEQQVALETTVAEPGDWVVISYDHRR